MSADLRDMNEEGGATAPLSHGEETLAGPRDYLALLKPRVMSLSIFTALAGMVAAPGAIESWPLALLSLLAIAIGAGASASFNMWWDSDIDAVMSRTKGRPVVTGKVPRAEAFGFGLVLTALSVWLLALTANYLAAGLLAFTIFFYVVIYSMGLKRTTTQNIVIGGAAGALPPVVGWAAVTGSAPLAAWSLFVIIFLWTPPHFWALALVKSEDYAAARIPMMPNVRGEAHTRRLIWQYSLVFVASVFLPLLFGFAGWLYGAVAAIGGGAFLHGAWRLRRDGSAPRCWHLFRLSILYLFVLFLALMLAPWLGLHG